MPAAPMPTLLTASRGMRPSGDRATTRVLGKILSTSQESSSGGRERHTSAPVPGSTTPNRPSFTPSGDG